MTCRVFLITVLLAMALALDPLYAMPVQGADREDDVYRIKAAFVYNFTKFIEWPDTTFPAADAPLVVAILGEGPLGAAMETMAGRKTMGRPIVVRRIGREEEVRGCQILIVDPAENTRLQSILHKLQGQGILTIGEGAVFAQNGGIVGFMLKDNKVRFAVNLGAANAAGLAVSSRLLQLATEVYR